MVALRDTPRPMNVGIIVPGFSADETDWCIPAHTDLVRELARKPTVHVYTLRYPHRVDTYRIGDATVHSFGGVGSRGLTSAQLWQRAVSAIRAEHAREPFDALVAIFGGEAGSVAVLAGKLLRVPSFVWFVNGELVGLPAIGYGADLFPRQRWMNRLILSHATRILCGCDNLTRAAHARVASSRRSMIATLPLGVNTDRFAPGSAAYNSPHFVNAGSLVSIKDHATLLRAFAQVRTEFPAARLSIAGEGYLQDELHTLTRELCLGDTVSRLGPVPHHQLPTLYQSANVYVQSSLHEGQGMALLEAVASGCAVCGSDVGILSDLARRNAALVAPAGDADALATVMLAAYSDRVALSSRSCEIVRREWNVDTIAARLSNLIAGIRRARTTSDA